MGIYIEIETHIAQDIAVACADRIQQIPINYHRTEVLEPVQ